MSVLEGKTSAQVLGLLGGRIEIDFSSQVEERLEIDVVQIGLKAGGTCLSLASRPVIVVPRTDNWFRQVFAIAHEIGHIANDTTIKRDDEISEQERGANRFAADLLMPKVQVERLVEGKVEPARFAKFLWDWGVSVAALVNRLNKFDLPTPDFLFEDEKTIVTQKFLGKHLKEIGLTWSDVQRRASLSGAQRFPAQLLTKLYEQVNSGKAPAQTYEWALGVQNTVTTAEESARETPEMLSADEVLELLEQ